MALSQRGQTWLAQAPSLKIWSVLQDLYDPETNPGGFVSLGVAENTLSHDSLVKYINNIPSLIQPLDLTYGNGGAGSKRLKRAMAQFLTRKLHPVNPILAAHVTITNGVTTAIEHLSSLLADPGDAFLVGRPFYHAFVGDIEARPCTEMLAIAFGKHIDPLGPEAVDAYEQQILECKKRNQRVAAILLCNPHNPLGRCYHRDVLVQYMRLCQKYRIHLISDEIYALSVFSTDGIQFTSLASLDTSGIIDPALTHVVYGVSKDFGANGLRLGAVISQYNSNIQNAVTPVSIYSYVSSLSDSAVSQLLEDEKFVDEYLAESNRKLSETYDYAVRWAEKYRIPYAKGVNAAFFLWVDLGSVYSQFVRTTGSKSNTTAKESAGSDLQALSEDTAKLSIPDDEIDDLVMDALMEEKIYLASGTKAGAESPGWFRIVFSHDKTYIDEGFARIEKAIGLR